MSDSRTAQVTRSMVCNALVDGRDEHACAIECHSAGARHSVHVLLTEFRVFSPKSIAHSTDMPNEPHAYLRPDDCLDVRKSSGFPSCAPSLSQILNRT